MYVTSVWLVKQKSNKNLFGLIIAFLQRIKGWNAQITSDFSKSFSFLKMDPIGVVNPNPNGENSQFYY